MSLNTKHSVLFSRVRQSGRGLPQSKTWRKLLRSITRVSVLDCGSPLPLSKWPASKDILTHF